MPSKAPDQAISRVYRDGLDSMLATAVANKNRAEFLLAVAAMLQGEIIGSGGKGIPCSAEADRMLRIVVHLLSGETPRPDYIREKLDFAYRGFDAFCAEVEKHVA